MPVADSQ